MPDESRDPQSDRDCSQREPGQDEREYDAADGRERTEESALAGVRRPHAHTTPFTTFSATR